MRLSLLCILSFGAAFMEAQSTDLGIFDPLMASTWQAEGTWGDGSDFYQEITFRYALDSSLILVETIGYVDEARSELGKRNHGVRQYDENAGILRFWEFDVFGGHTEGKIVAQGKNILYQYSYQGSEITDLWEYLEDDTYRLRVGTFDGDQWKAIFLDTKFVRVPSK